MSPLLRDGAPIVAVLCCVVRYSLDKYTRRVVSGRYINFGGWGVWVTLLWAQQWYLCWRGVGYVGYVGVWGLSVVFWGLLGCGVRFGFVVEIKSFARGRLASCVEILFYGIRRILVGGVWVCMD